jgi:hypothetical protein
MNTQQTPEDAAYEAQALAEEIAALTDDIQSLVSQRETLMKRLEQLASGHDVPPFALRLLPALEAEPPSGDELRAGAGG